MEWEQEQLRRGGLRTTEAAEKAPKPVYKPSPSRLLLVPLFKGQFTNVYFC